MIKVSVIGAGTMGSGIAQIAATKGHEVCLYDSFTESLENSKNKLNKILHRLVEKERINNETKEQIISRIKFSNNLEDIQKSSLVIEAIIEDLNIKQKLFQEIESIVDKNCIIATNTSSLSIASIAGACEGADRVIGIHFFNPAPLMPLVEIIPAVQTSEETNKKTKELIDSWDKVTVIVKDTPGFIVNRVARPFYGEALRIYEEGIADFATIDWAMKDIGGFRMGPFELMDYIGNDVNYTVTETVFTAFYFDPRYKPSFTQKRMKEAQDQIKKMEVEGVSGGNLVRVVLSGDYELKSIQISENAKKENQEIINDLIIAAYNNAKENLKKKSAEELSKATGGLNLPLDFKLPF